VLYDGVVDSKWGRKGPNQGQLCLQNNGNATFLNFDLPGQMKHAIRNMQPYACSLPALAAVNIPQLSAAGAASAGAGSGSAAGAK
jgi:hypothetical protein